MLVDCPECKKEISSEAKQCPYCGLPNAGARSRQVAELRAKYLQKKIGTFAIGRCCTCSKCNEYNSNNEFVSCEVKFSKESPVEFYTLLGYKCANCGNIYYYI